LGQPAYRLPCPMRPGSLFELAGQMVRLGQSRDKTDLVGCHFSKVLRSDQCGVGNVNHPLRIEETLLNLVDDGAVPSLVACVAVSYIAHEGKTLSGDDKPVYELP